MNTEYKAKWLGALRSGEWKQAQGALRDDGKYCCLGVLCSLVPGVEWVLKEGKGSYLIKDWFANYGFDSAPGVLPEALQVEMNMTETEMNDLATMNDNGRTFKEIADWIERHL